MTPETVVERLEGARRSGDGWTARCPAHEDRRSSLSIGIGDGGRVLLHCHAGCELGAILAALRLEPKDLGPEREERARPRIVASYDYRTEAGELAYQVLRFAPKDFRQRRPDGAGGWTWKLNGVTRMPYRLPELLGSTGPVFAVEGEKDADALARLGLVATTNAGGAGKPWPTEWAAYFADRVVYVLPDHDEPGRQHAEQVARVLRGRAASVRVVALPGLPPKGDVSDWLGAGGTVEELLKLCAADREPGDDDDESWRETDAADAWEPPIPLGALVGERPAFPVDALPPWLRDMVVAVSEFNQTPPDLAAILGLAVLSTAARGRYNIECPPGHNEPLALYLAVVLPPGERKSSVFAAMARPLVEWERDQCASQADERTERESERAMLQKRIDHLHGRAAKNDDRDERRSIMYDATSAARQLEALPPLAPPALLVDDVTPEALVSTLAEQGGRVALLSAEGGIFDVIAGLYSDARSNLDGILKAHDAEPIRVRRQTRAPVHVDRPVLTIGLAVQPSVLEQIGENRRLRGRGLLARFLYSVPESRLGRRSGSPPPVPATVAAEYARHVRALLDSTPDDVETLKCSGDEIAAWRQFAAALEPRLAPGTGDLASIGDWAGKLSGAVARIAGLLSLGMGSGNCGNCGPKSPKNLVSSAIHVGNYLIAHALVAFGAMGEDPGTSAARHVLAWVVGRTEFRERDAYQALKGRASLATVDRLRAALRVLELHGYVRPRPSARSGPGRPASPWYDVSPYLGTPLAHNSHNSRNPESRGNGRSYGAASRADNSTPNSQNARGVL